KGMLPLTRSVGLRVRNITRLLLAASLMLAGSAAFASDSVMPLSQIQKGMKGYGVTVFEGNKLEKFDVEIVGVMTNIAPDQDMILARVSNPVTDHAGIIAGMSGSPVYIDGKVIGALAYGWQFAKDSICGITPINEMLKIASRGGNIANAEIAAATPRITGAEFLKALGNNKPEAVFDKIATSFNAKAMSAWSGAKPIAVPLSMSSFAPETVQRFAPFLDEMGFVAVPAGSTSGSKTTTTTDTKANFAPGDPIGAVLLTGDFNVAATGTVTHVDGNRVYAFGHPFLDIGEVDFPMAKSEIITVMPSLASSFKMANSGAIVGAFHQDRATGIMGNVGDDAAMIPVTMTVDGSGAEKTYHVGIVRHTQLSPLILAMAADTVVANAQKGAGERTVLLDADIRVKGFEPIHLREGWAGAQARSAIPAYLAVVSGYLMSNEFRDATIEGISMRLHHDDSLRTAKLLEASIATPDNGRISPGDTVKVRAVLKPYRGEPFTDTFDVKIPDNQPVGNAYLLIGSGTMMNQIDFSLVPPDPRTLGQVLATLERLRPSTDLTVGVYSTDDGAVTAGVYLPNLPPTMHAVVSNDTSNAAQAAVKYHSFDHQAHPLGYIVDGALKIDLDIKPAI
ncbi:MAG TPA: SpoIVB peptidase S55 domain-containing protein, partial [Thermoanaerobaculia bacterium]|nr:SpoIVB peptidase S55 domain-containing protein [Thermoanaerobaculia bacterium]